MSLVVRVQKLQIDRCTVVTVLPVADTVSASMGCLPGCVQGVGRQVGGYQVGGYLLPGTCLACLCWPWAVPGWPWLSLCPLAHLALRLSSHRTCSTGTVWVRAVRVTIHVRGGPAKGFLVSSESKSTGSISNSFSLEEVTPFVYLCFSV